MKVIARFCQSLIENELKPLSKVPFTLHGETRPTHEDLSLNPINIFYHSEPNEYFSSHDWIRENYHLFDYVLTWNHELIRDLPNAIFTPFGTSAFHDKFNFRDFKAPGEDGVHDNKTNKVTFIRGAKHANVQGHHLRHELYNRRAEIHNIQTEFYDKTTPEYAATPEEDIQWFNQRTSIFKSPFFHICIENTFHENYFTEKIIDCFLFRTMPIYYGCPNIGEYFDKNGIITFQTVDELIDICNSLTTDMYTENVVAVYNNQIECLRYLNLGRTIRNTIVNIFQKKYPDYLKLI